MATTNPTKSTARTMNAELAAAGFAERVRQGNGYVYLYDGEAEGWFSSSIAVCYTRDIAPGTIVRLRNEMATDRF
jgi:hypothetical protein